MCFSAPASFTAGAALTAAGIVTQPRAKTLGERLYAAVPLFFGIQQLLEGFQWLADKPGPASQALGYAYLFFAYLFWPTFVPIVVYLIEKDPKRKQVLAAFIALGVAVSLASLYKLGSYPLVVTEVCHSLAYRVGTPTDMLGLLLYVIATCGSMACARRPGLRLMAIVALIAFIVSDLAFTYAFASVWCFFAAILSVVIFVDLYAPKQLAKFMRMKAV